MIRKLTESSEQWDRYYDDLKHWEETYERKMPKEFDYDNEEDFQAAMRKWDFERHMNEPNKPGYIIANND